MSTPLPHQRKNDTALDRAPFELIFSENVGITFEADETAGEDTADIFVLRIAQGKEVEIPVLLKFKASTKESKAAFTLIIHAQEGTKVTVVEDADGHILGSLSFQRRIIAEKGSIVRYAALQNSQAKDWQENTETEAREDAFIHLSFFHFGAQKVESKIDQKAEGSRARIDTDFATRRSGNESLTLACSNQFSAPDGTGQIALSGVALDASELTFDGMIHIGKNGGGTDSFLGEAILNLSEKTKVSAKPGLEIDTNDVKAGHSAAVHNLGDEDLIYLSSRGLPLKEARDMMINGFLKSALDTVKDIPAMHATIYEII